MRSQNCVYLLKPIYDVPVYEGFATEGGEGLHFLPDELNGREWQIPRVAAT